MLLAGHAVAMVIVNDNSMFANDWAVFWYHDSTDSYEPSKSNLSHFRWLKTVTSTIRDVDFDGSLLPL